MNADLEKRILTPRWETEILFSDQGRGNGLISDPESVRNPLVGTEQHYLTDHRSESKTTVWTLQL